MRTAKYKKMVCTIIAAILLAVFYPVGIEAVSGKFNMSYIYFGNHSTHASYVERTNGSIDEISPSYFDLNADGSLKITSAASRNFVDRMHAQNVRVVPFLSNHWNRAVGRAALARRDALAREIAAAVTTYRLDGINVDLENLTPSDRDAQTDFIRLLRTYLPADKTIAVAVAANPWGVGTGWQGSYDYAGLAKYSDYLMIMAYDEHYQSGPPGPVASLSFAERSVQYALKHVPREKIVLGLAFYGRIWRNGGGSPQGFGVSNTRVESLIRDYRGKIIFDTQSRTPYASITIHPNDPKPVIGGSALQSGTYTIWYENEASLKEKLLLVTRYGLKGTGSWSLGQETASTWNYYRLWLNGCTFYDMQGHWAQGSVLTAFKNGWVNGVTPYSFSPDAPLTRAQAAVILVRAFGLSPSPDAPVFTDTSGHWAKNEIESARYHGFVAGMGNHLFAPDAPITREQMAVLLGNIIFRGGALPEKLPSYPDICTNDNFWSYSAISAMSELSLLSGFPDGSFRPKHPLLRAQMVSVIERIKNTHTPF